MNFMDLVPVDWIPGLAALIGIPYMKVVPTTDPNATFGMSLSVFALTIYYSIKVKGIGGFIGELTGQPFASTSLLGKIVFFIPNLLLELVSLIDGTQVWKGQIAGESNGSWEAPPRAQVAKTLRGLFAELLRELRSADWENDSAALLPD